MHGGCIAAIAMAAQETGQAVSTAQDAGTAVATALDAGTAAQAAGSAVATVQDAAGAAVCACQGKESTCRLHGREQVEVVC